MRPTPLHPLFCFKAEPANAAGLDLGWPSLPWVRVRAVRPGQDAPRRVSKVGVQPGVGPTRTGTLTYVRSESPKVPWATTHLAPREGRLTPLKGESGSVGFVLKCSGSSPIPTPGPQLSESESFGMGVTPTSSPREGGTLVLFEFFPWAPSGRAWALLLRWS